MALSTFVGKKTSTSPFLPLSLSRSQSPLPSLPASPLPPAPAPASLSHDSVNDALSIDDLVPILKKHGISQTSKKESLNFPSRSNSPLEFHSASNAPSPSPSHSSSSSSSSCSSSSGSKLVACNILEDISSSPPFPLASSSTPSTYIADDDDDVIHWQYCSKPGLPTPLNQFNYGKITNDKMDPFFLHAREYFLEKWCFVILPYKTRKTCLKKLAALSSSSTNYIVFLHNASDGEKWFNMKDWREEPKLMTKLHSTEFQYDIMLPARGCDQLKELLRVLPQDECTVEWRNAKIEWEEERYTLRLDGNSLELGDVPCSICKSNCGSWIATLAADPISTSHTSSSSLSSSSLASSTSLAQYHSLALTFQSYASDSSSSDAGIKAALDALYPPLPLPSPCSFTSQRALNDDEFLMNSESLSACTITSLAASNSFDNLQMIVTNESIDAGEEMREAADASKNKRKRSLSAKRQHKKKEKSTKPRCCTCDFPFCLRTDFIGNSIRLCPGHMDKYLGSVYVLDMNTYEVFLFLGEKTSAGKSTLDLTRLNNYLKTKLKMKCRQIRTEIYEKFWTVNSHGQQTKKKANVLVLLKLKCPIDNNAKDTFHLTKVQHCTLHFREHERKGTAFAEVQDPDLVWLLST